MCLGEIAQVVQLVDDRTVRARVGERLADVSLLTLEGPVAPGDWLQVHSGFALARLTEEEQREAERIGSSSARPPTHAQPLSREPEPSAGADVPDSW